MRTSSQRERTEERKAYIALRRAVRAAGVKVSFVDDKDANYVIIAQNHIVLRKGMSLRETLYVLAHEFGHVQSNFSGMSHVYATYCDERAGYVDRMVSVVEELDAWDNAYKHVPARLRIDCECYAVMCLKTYTSRKNVKKAEKLRRK